jgi:hypothetical protein
VKVPRFVRQLVVTFFVGDLPAITQKPERPYRRQDGRPRPVRLVSAGSDRRRR